MSGGGVICAGVAVGGEMAFTALGKTLFLSLVVVVSVVLYFFLSDARQTNKLSGSCSVASSWKHFSHERRCHEGHS